MNYIKKYISLLKQINGSNMSSTIHINAQSHNEADRLLFIELKEEGYFNGKVIYDGKNEVSNIRPSVKGRIFQEELEHKLRERTFKGRILKYLPITFAIVLGFFFNAILEILKKYIF